jgi:hypothetical protein
MVDAVRVPDGAESRPAGIQGDPEDADWLEEAAAGAGEGALAAMS